MKTYLTCKKVQAKNPYVTAPKMTDFDKDNGLEPGCALPRLASQPSGQSAPTIVSVATRTTTGVTRRCWRGAAPQDGDIAHQPSYSTIFRYDH